MSDPGLGWRGTTQGGEFSPWREYSPSGSVGIEGRLVYLQVFRHAESGGPRRASAVRHPHHLSQAGRHRRSPRSRAGDERRRRHDLRGAVRNRRRRSRREAALRGASRLHRQRAREPRPTGSAISGRSRTSGVRCRLISRAAWPRSTSTGSASSKRAGDFIPTRIWRPICSATWASTATAWAASNRPTTRRSEASREPFSFTPMRIDTPSAASERPPTEGATLELTIDEYLQHVAERELRLGVAENRAAGGRRSS